MKIFQNDYHISDTDLNFLQTNLFTRNYHPSKICFFDIETTGLSPDISSVYLIGCAYIKNNSLHMKQWFADDYISEKQMLDEFSQLIQSFDLIVHYNGTGFDLPYLKKKAKHYHLSDPFSTIESLDYYTMIRKHKKIFCLPNYRQKSIEKYLNMNRNDQYDGGELIHFYSSYMKSKYFRDKKEEDYQKILLLHNSEDIRGLFYITSLIHEISFFYECPDIEKTESNDSTLTIYCKGSELTHLKDFSCTLFHVFFKKEQLCFRIPLKSLTLKYFIKDYKNYYYLTKEDTAIHKSIACYVEKEFKEKAKASTCYTTKTGIFLPYPVSKKCSTDLGLHLFKENYKDKLVYAEVNELLENKERLQTYLQNLLLYYLE